MDIAVADWSEILGVLKETHGIWSSGLDKSRYYHYIWWQLHSIWGRRNYLYLVGRENRRIVTSCKLYTLEFFSAGGFFRLAGLGAIFTPEEFRGQGCAGRFIKKLRARCRDLGYDGLLLHSDIDPGFYERVGFEPLGGHDFHIFLVDAPVAQKVITLPGFVEDMQAEPVEITALDVCHIPSANRHHRRWLARRPYGLIRSEQYWSYKIQRENYVAKHCPSNWPGLEMIGTNIGCSSGGYAIFEKGKRIVRVLEVVGAEDVRQALWRHILRSAWLGGTALIRGFEGAAPESVPQILFAGRDWGSPMLLPLNKALFRWAAVSPCPLLEFDHF